MAKTNPTDTILLGTGDLIVDHGNNSVGILLQKHKVLKSGIDGNWEWAWRIKWSKTTKFDPEGQLGWISFHASSEKSLIREIREGLVEHYGTD